MFETKILFKVNLIDANHYKHTLAIGVDDGNEDNESVPL